MYVYMYVYVYVCMHGCVCKCMHACIERMAIKCISILVAMIQWSVCGSERWRREAAARG